MKEPRMKRGKVNFWKETREIYREGGEGEDEVTRDHLAHSGQGQQQYSVIVYRQIKNKL